MFIKYTKTSENNRLFSTEQRPANEQYVRNKKMFLAESEKQYGENAQSFAMKENVVVQYHGDELLQNCYSEILYKKQPSR